MKYLTIPAGMLMLMVWAHFAYAVEPTPFTHVQVPPAQAPPDFVKETKQILALSLNEQIVALIFVSSTGEVMPTKIEECYAHPECMSMTKTFYEQKKVTVLQLHTDHLPKRDHGLDSQGHNSHKGETEISDSCPSHLASYILIKSVPYLLGCFA